MDTPDAGPVSNATGEQAAHNSSYLGEDSYKLEISPNRVDLLVAGGAITLSFDAPNAVQFALEIAQAGERAQQMQAEAGLN